VFWNPAQELPEAGAPVGRFGGPVLMVLPTAALVVVSIAIAAAAAPLYAFTERAAADLLEPSDYVRAVLGS
ncbi:MAG TPA: Na+/H+ antiporter subunit D, partial [Acidimicrobiales bacterium]